MAAPASIALSFGSGKGKAAGVYKIQSGGLRQHLNSKMQCLLSIVTLAACGHEVLHQQQSHRSKCNELSNCHTRVILATKSRSIKQEPDCLSVQTLLHTTNKLYIIPCNYSSAYPQHPLSCGYEHSLPYIPGWQRSQHSLDTAQPCHWHHVAAHQHQYCRCSPQVWQLTHHKSST